MPGFLGFCFLAAAWWGCGAHRGGTGLPVTEMTSWDTMTMGVPRRWGLVGGVDPHCLPELSCSTVSPLGLHSYSESGPPHRLFATGGALPVRVWEKHFLGVLWRGWRMGTMNGEWPAVHEGGAPHPQLDIWGGGGGHDSSLLLSSLPAAEMGV